jgi:L-seryl-tRNA(Ser) seleniumtransferase
MMAKQDDLAALPKVDQILDHPLLLELGQKLPRELIKRAVRETIDGLRQAILAGGEVPGAELGPEAVARAASATANKLATPKLRRLINATGVVVHTNLGRSLLAKRAITRLVEINRAYSNLEYDLEAGHRGSRYDLVTELLTEITGAEAALVVNNNAGAVFLTLLTLAKGKEVIVSRGQLVEIGGSFRIPDIMASSGAALIEVGTTNKTHLKDYENAISSETAMILKVHTSNYAVVGFHKEVPLSELKELAACYHLPVVEDLGSGSLMELAAHGLSPEPTVQDALAQGADLVSFSGDKLLGGPQAGIILGRAELIKQLRSNPLNRAFRIDKLTLAALEATLELYRDPTAAMKEIPTLHMLTLDYGP